MSDDDHVYNFIELNWWTTCKITNTQVTIYDPHLEIYVFVQILYKFKFTHNFTIEFHLKLCSIANRLQFPHFGSVFVLISWLVMVVVLLLLILKRMCLCAIVSFELSHKAMFMWLMFRTCRFAMNGFRQISLADRG